MGSVPYGKEWEVSNQLLFFGKDEKVWHVGKYGRVSARKTKSRISVDIWEE